MVIQEYIDYINKVCAGDKINPFLNMRGWDYEMIMNNADFKNTDEVLDTGALHTYFSIYLSQFVKSIYTTDNFYWAKREYAKDLPTPQEWMDYVMSKSKKINAMEADLISLPFKPDSFDKTICISTIEHVKDDRKALEELLRVTKPGGEILITTEFNVYKGKDYSEEDGSYYRIYDDNSMNKLLEGISNLFIGRSPTEKQNYEEKGFTTIFISITK